jgi:hypothetical protein
MMINNRFSAYRSAITRAVSTIGIAVLPIMALAQTAEDAPQPLDPRAKALQLRTYGAVALLAAIALGWYFFRRWQLSRMDTTNGLGYHNED